MVNSNFILILTAAGSSTRLNEKIKKEFITMKNSKSVLYNALKEFTTFSNMKALVVTYKKNEKEKTMECLFEGKDLSIPYYFVQGGESRTESIKNALIFIKEQNISNDSSLILIHDGARPFIDHETIKRVIEGAQNYGGAVPGILAPRDTVSRVDKNGFISEKIDRDKLYQIQTPQGFIKEKIIESYEKISGVDIFLDDEEVFRKNGGKVFVTKGNIKNKKITYKEDLEDLWE